MATLQKNNARQLVLLIIMLIVGIMVVKQYVGSIQIPTTALIKERIAALESARNDLTAARVEERTRLEELEKLRSQAEDFWLSTSQKTGTEQEITRDFNKLLRRAQLPSNQKVDVSWNKLPGANYIQEVQIKLELRGVTMREVTRLLQEIKKAGNKLTWTQCQISPENPRNPQNVNLTGKLRALVISEEASQYLLGTSTSDSSLAPQQAKDSNASRKVPSSRMKEVKGK